MANPPARSIPSPCSTYAFNSASYNPCAASAYTIHYPLISLELVRRLTVFSRKCAIVETEMDLLDMASIPSALPIRQAIKGNKKEGAL
jgi:hypothetical protein